MLRFTLRTLHVASPIDLWALFPLPPDWHGLVSLACTCGECAAACQLVVVDGLPVHTFECRTTAWQQLQLVLAERPELGQRVSA